MNDEQFGFTIPELVKRKVFRSPSAAYRALRDGSLKAFKQGKRTIITPEQVREYRDGLPLYQARAVPHLARKKASAVEPESKPTEPARGRRRPQPRPEATA